MGHPKTSSVRQLPVDSRLTTTPIIASCAEALIKSATGFQSKLNDLELTRTLIGRVAFGMTVMVISGCQTADMIGSRMTKKWLNRPTVIETTFKVSPDVNPNVYGDAQAIWVRFYVLESMGAFNSADIFQLKNQDEELLAQDLKLRELLSLAPAEKRKETFTIAAEETKEKELFVAIVAGYRDWGNAVWRATTAVRARKKTPLVVYLDRLEVRLEKED